MAQISDDLDEASEKAMKRGPKATGTANRVIEGTFMSGRTHGHLNGYRYQLIAKKIRNVVTPIIRNESPC
jgi:hypothetical protein